MTRLLQTVIEIERHCADAGWDAPPRLFALVATADLLARQPDLGLTAPAAEERLALLADPGCLTPVEQDELPPYATLEELLAGIAWPPEVLGAALSVERLMLPPGVEAAMPQGEQEALRWVAEHPDRQDVRLVVAVLRDGTRQAALRSRSQDRAQDVLTGHDLVPALADALAATLRD